MAFMQHCHFKTLSLRQLTLYYIEMRKEVVLATFYNDGESIFKDVTDNYKKTYPHIKKVELQAICAIEELEPDK